MNSDDDDFESVGDHDDYRDDQFEDSHPIDVSVTNLGGSKFISEVLDENVVDDNSAAKDISDEDDGDVGFYDIPEDNGRKIKLSLRSPEVLLGLYKKKIQISTEKKEYDNVIENLVRCSALTRIVFGDRSWKYAESESDIALAYWRYKGMAAQAQQHAEEARNIMLRVVQSGEVQEDKGSIYRVLLSVYITLGEAQNAQKKYTDSELSFQKAEKILAEEKKLKSHDIDGIKKLQINLLVAQGKLTANQGKAASSIAYFEQAVSLIEDLQGKDSVRLIALYQLIGKVEQTREQTNHEKSIAAYLQAHSIASANYSEGTTELADSGFELALAYTRVGDSDAETSAESYLNSCLASYLTVFGPNHDKTIQCQDELTRLMIRTDRPEEALQLLRSTIRARKEVSGDYSDSLASTYKLIGSVHMSEGHMDNALKAMNKCLQMQVFMYGPNSRCVKQTQKTVDLLMSDPKLAVKANPSSRFLDLSARPRFNTIVKGDSNLGGFKACF